MRLVALPVLLLGLLAVRVEAYIDTAPSLGTVVAQASSIAVLEVDKVSPEKRVVIYKKVADLKGALPAEPIRHALSDGGHPREPKAVLDWARPGRKAIGFMNAKTFLVCTGTLWYESAQAEPSWWTMTRGCPEVLYSYAGSVERLRGHVVDMLAGKEVVVTAVSYAGTPSGVDFATAIHYRSSLRGIPFCRLRASLKLTSYRPEQLVGKNGGTEEDVPGWLKTLDQPDVAARVDAAEELGRIGPPAKAAVPALEKMLKDPNPLARRAAATSLASIDPKNAGVLPALLGEMKGAPDDRRSAAEALGDLGAPAVPALAEALKDVDAGVRWTAAESLGRIGPAAKAAVAGLAEALRDPEIRSIAADALGGIGPEAKPAVPGLVDLVRTQKDPSLRRTAGLALFRIDKEAAGVAAPVFAEGLRNPDGRVRHDSIILLVRLGPAAREATPVLTELLKDKAEWTRQPAAHALGTSKDPRAVPALIEAMEKDAHVAIRSTAAQALGHIGPEAKAAVPALEAKLGDPDIGTKLMAAEALWRVNKDAAKAVPVLLQGLTHKNLYMVGLSSGMIGRMGADAKLAVPHLLPLLKLEDEPRRKAIETLLKSIDPKAAAEAGVR